MKIRDGDVVCIMMPNSPEYALATLGALEAGAEVTTANPIYTPCKLLKEIQTKVTNNVVADIEIFFIQS